MKKVFLLLAVLLSISAYAKNTLHGFQPKEQAKNFMRGQSHTSQQLFSFDNAGVTTHSVSKTMKNNTIEPACIIQGSWGTFYNIESGVELRYKLDFESYQQNYGIYYNNFTIRFFDDNFTETSSSFTVDLPENTNRFVLQPDCNNDYFLVYIHYFEGAVGPDFQVHEILLVNKDGNVLKRFKDRTGALLIENKLIILHYDDYNPEIGVHFFNSTTFEEEYSISISQELTLNLGGAILTISEFEGETYIVIAYYEEKFMDMMTFEMTPDNRLCLDVYNLNYDKVKEVRMPLIYPEELFVLPTAAFGAFLPKFDITRNVFNDDDKWEFFMPIYVMTMTSDWYNFYVVNEDGDILKTFDEKVVDYLFLSDIEGYDTMANFITVDEEGNQQLQCFNVESWKTELILPAMHNGDFLSVYFDRIKTDNDFEYLMGLRDLEEIDGRKFGIIKGYDRKGQETQKIGLPLTENSFGFQPGLGSSTLNPHMFDSDDEMDYIYSDGNAIFFAKGNAEEPFYVIRDEERKPAAYFFSYDDNGKPVRYMQNMSSYTVEGITLVYDLPFLNSVSIDNPSNAISNVEVYPNPTADNLFIRNAEDDVRLYDVRGKLLKTVKNNDQNEMKIDMSNYGKGVYLINTGKTMHKVIKK
jgi:hypothetical protein